MFQYFVFQNICEKLGIHKDINYGDAIFYNVSYDKMLIPAVEGKDRNDTLGVYAVTDRQKLIRFLHLLNKTNKYKYVIVDLTFDKKESSIYDDTLFHQISKMRDVVVANHTEINFADSNLVISGKTGLVTYYSTTASTNFGRFVFTINDVKSLPIVVYESIYPEKRMERHGCGYLSFYTIGGNLCQNCCFLTFDKSYINPAIEKLNDTLSIQSSKYINLGRFISSPDFDEDLLSKLIDTNTTNKYVVIGDFIEDVSDTYIGQMPSPVITMRALATLEEGGNLVFLSHLIGWFVIFFMINLSIFYNKPVYERFPFLKRINYKWFQFLFSIISYGFILMMGSTIEYIFDYPVYSLMIPLLYFSIIKILIQYKHTN